jgi:uroporphyrinogen III methyltransferase/synthase
MAGIPIKLRYSQAVRKIIMGTRASKLALRQAEEVKRFLEKLYPEVEVIFKRIKTQGDVLKDWRPGGSEARKGLFVKEIEDALLAGEIDLAVHSMKDVPTELPEGLTIAAITKRVDPRDVLISRDGLFLDKLPRDARVGTSSLRRKLQLLFYRRDLQVVPLRGNLDTRLRKLKEGEINAILVAAAGLIRLGWQNKITQYLPYEIMLPAGGQGALGIEIREKNERIKRILQPLNHDDSRVAITAERCFLRRLGGGCQVPVATLSRVRKERLSLEVVVTDSNGEKIIGEKATGLKGNPEELGLQLAEKILGKGFKKTSSGFIFQKPHLGGRVYLVGAGPGDPGLITLKGVECIKKADIIIYDRLVNKKFLDYAKDSCKFIYMGKLPGESPSQAQINQMMVRKARKGKIIVRLKGGDPFILGRGAEEVEFVADNNIDFEVIPGISSVVAAPTYAGIPLTHRRFSSSLTIVTGHEDPLKEKSGVNWTNLTQGNGTLVILMGLANLPQIVKKLISAGKSENTACAVISWGTTPSQKVVKGTLAEMVEKAKGIEPPAVIVIGEVVSLREKLNWFKKKPLFGKQILITRAAALAKNLVGLLEDQGAEVVKFPTIKISSLNGYQKLDLVIERLSDYDWIIFTSPNGVNHFWRRLKMKGRDVRSLSKLKIGAIGPKTVVKLENMGITADFLPDEYSTQGIIKGIKRFKIKGKKILLPRADIAPSSLPNGLKKLGAIIEEVTAYETQLPERENFAAIKNRLKNRKVDVIIFTSSSTVRNFIKLMGDIDLGGAKVACIGPITAREAELSGIKPGIVPPEYTIESLVEEIINVLSKSTTEKA